MRSTGCKIEKTRYSLPHVKKRSKKGKDFVGARRQLPRTTKLQNETRILIVAFPFGWQLREMSKALQREMMKAAACVSLKVVSRTDGLGVGNIE